MTSPLAIDAHAVRFAYERAAPVLDIETLQIAAGERVFIMGASGSGKSTLLSLLSGVLQSDEGTLNVLGHDLSRMPARRRDAFRGDHIGYVFQAFNLVPYLSVADNVALPCKFSKLRRVRSSKPADAAAELLSGLGLEAELNGRKPAELSVGQQQRVAVARALIGQPELLVCDEPTSALDHAARDQFLELLLAQCEGANTTLLFVSHDQTLASHFDRVIDLAKLNRVAA